MNDKQACLKETMTVETRGLVDSFEGVGIREVKQELARTKTPG